MITSFGSRETQQVWEGTRVARWPHEIQHIARRKLRMIHNLQDLMIPPANRLEKLKGALKEYYSIRINDQWRVIFIWNEGNASDVQVTDYH